MSILRVSKMLPSVDSLQKKSAIITDAFTKAAQDYKQVNEEISAVVAQKEEQIKSLQSEVSILDSIKGRNAKIAGKIEAFINE